MLGMQALSKSRFSTNTMFVSVGAKKVLSYVTKTKSILDTTNYPTSD